MGNAWHADPNALIIRTLRCAVVSAIMAWTAIGVAACTSPEPFTYGLFGSADEYASGPGFLLDDDGVLTRDYGAAYGDLGIYHNPFFISRYAHALYRDYYETGCSSEELRSRFLAQAHWFRTHHDVVDGMAYWRFDFVNDRFDLPAGWISGIGQSHIAGVLLRAASMTNDDELVDLARQAVEVYLRPVDEGGVISDEPFGLWIQEYPTVTADNTSVLNGHITGLLGLIDVAELIAVPELAAVVAAAIDAVRATIGEFDAGFTSFYSRVGVHGEPPIPVPVHGYNGLHVTQLLALFELDGDPAFLEMAMRWQAYAAIEYRRTAAGTTDPNFGPERADGESGLRYWSHNVFPTWYAVEFDTARTLLGVYVRGRDHASTPRDFRVSVATADGWRTAWSTEGNTDQASFARFDTPLMTHAYRLDIDSDNGNGNVAIHMTYPVFADAGLSAVTNYCNHRYRSDPGHWAIDAALHGGTLTIHCDGFVVLPRLTGVLSVGSIGDPSATVPVAASDDLGTWTPIGTISSESPDIVVPHGEFVRLEVAAEVAWLQDIRVERYVGTRDEAVVSGPDHEPPRWMPSAEPDIVLRDAHGSTSPATHGPEQATPDGTYWSHDTFPTWYEVAFAQPVVLTGVEVIGHTPSATPRDFDLSVATSDGWAVVWSTQTNDRQALRLTFEEPVETSAFRLDIRRDNGNDNVALGVVAPIVHTPSSTNTRLMPGVIAR